MPRIANIAPERGRSPASPTARPLSRTRAPATSGDRKEIDRERDGEAQHFMIGRTGWLNSRRWHAACRHDPNDDHQRNHRRAQPIGLETAEQPFHRSAHEETQAGEGHDPNRACRQHPGHESAKAHTDRSGDERRVDAEAWQESGGRDLKGGSPSKPVRRSLVRSAGMQADGKCVHALWPDPVSPRVAGQDAGDHRQISERDDQPDGCASAGHEKTRSNQHRLAGRHGEGEAGLFQEKQGADDGDAGGFSLQFSNALSGVPDRSGGAGCGPSCSTG